MQVISGKTHANKENMELQLILELFSNFGLTIGMNLRFYTSVANVLKLKVKNFCGPSPTFLEVTGKSKKKKKKKEKKKKPFKRVTKLYLMHHSFVFIIFHHFLKNVLMQVRIFYLLFWEISFLSFCLLCVTSQFDLLLIESVISI